MVEEPRTEHAATTPRALYLTWAALVALTLAGALLSGGGGSGRSAAAGLLALGWLKLTLIARVFMELGRPHRAWLVVVAGGGLVVLVACFVAGGMGR